MPGPEGAERPVGPHEPLLRRVLGFGGVARDEERRAEGRLLVLADELLEGTDVAPLGPLDQLSFFQAWSSALWAFCVIYNRQR